MTKRNIAILLWSALVTAVLLLVAYYALFTNPLHLQAYDALVKLRSQYIPPPSAIKDVVLVKIDNDTMKNMPESWPYSRATFARVIDQLRKAGARTIGFDFVFYGRSSAEDDALLKQAFENAGDVVVGSTLDESGGLNVAAYSTPADTTASGIVTKFEDFDKAIRRNLTYLVTGRSRQNVVLSWEMGILKMDKGIDLASLSDSASRMVFLRNGAGEEWRIPVEPQTGTFLINYKAKPNNFQGLSFYRVLDGNFDANMIKNKIVLIGFTSVVLGDIHSTPLGWIPGLTLSANAFLTLYAHDFLDEIPKWIEALVVLMGAIAATLFVLFFERKKAFFLVVAELALFAIASFILLLNDMTWDYSLFPLATVISAALSRKLMDKIA
jgi:CHASE2 domain-containing sensor protein